MPSLKGHIATATLVGGAAVYFKIIPIELLNISLGIGALIGTVIPDLDHQSSTVNQKILIINKKWFQVLIYGLFSISLIYYLGKEMKVILAALLIFITGLLPHRAFTHKLGGLSLICLTVYLFLGWTPLSIGIMAGMIVHIAADRINDWLF